jgi:hypothetical protein
MALKLLRLVAVLMALVVPLQGLAAVSAAQCMALGHHQDGDEHGHDVHSHADDGQVGKPETNGHCGPCAACCASVAIASRSDVWFLPSPTSAPYVVSQAPPTGIAPDGVYRPPHTL